MGCREYISAMKLLDIISTTSKEKFNHFICHPERKNLAKACIEVKNVMDWNFKFSDFYKDICAFRYPPLEFLWNLHLLQVMPLESYIFNIYTEKDLFQKFQESIIELFTQDLDEREEEYLVQTGFLSYFILKAFPASDDLVNERSKEVCLDTIEKLLKDMILSGDSQIGSRRYSGFYSLWNAGIVEEASLQAFCSFAISYYLKSFPPANDFDAFEVFETADTSCSSRHILTLLEKLVKPQKFERISPIFIAAVQNLETNAKCLLSLVRAVLNTHQESAVSIHKLMSEVMNEAFENLHYGMLLRSLLITRQASLQTSIAPQICYKKWLQSIFKDYGPLKNVECFSLLIRILSDLVPFYKSTECIKVAIEFNVSVPTEAQVTYNDYIILLKTRMHDLKPHVKPAETVEKILSLYEILGKIPPVIMEASLLQKHKFLNEFLPALLTPRLVPQIPDVKEKFIDALDKAGKIPSNLLQRYRSGCKEEQKSLLSDVNMVDDNFDDFLEDSDVILLD